LQANENKACADDISNKLVIPMYCSLPLSCWPDSLKKSRRILGHVALKTFRLLFGCFGQIGRVLLSLFGIALLLCGSPGGMAQGQTLSLVWSDEFNGASLDLTKWTYDNGNGSPAGWGNNEYEYYTSRTNNVYVSGGLLHIRAQTESTNGLLFTSGRIKTEGLFWKTFGRIEWRAKLPSGIGMWPALWSLGTNINSIGWPGCGEIDVVEDHGDNIFFEQGSIHSGSDATKVFNFTGGDSVTNFHVYDLDWTNNMIIWSVDSMAYETQTVWTSSTGMPYPFPFNQPFHFLMNLAVGGNYTGNPSNALIEAILPQELQVDYMRVYDYIAPTNTLATPTGLTATLTGSSVVLNWQDLFGASVCYVKRSASGGGPYTTIGTASTPTYTDTSATICETNYYVVSRTNSFGESANSTEVSAKPVAFSYFAVNSGGSPAGSFVADTDVTGGTIAATSTATIITNGLINPAPQAVYKTERYGNFNYTFGGLTTGVTYTVRLHEAEIYFNAASNREFNVFINGKQVLTNFDIWSTAGGENIAVIKQYSILPQTNGQISITYSNGAVDDAKSSGIEIIAPPLLPPTGLAATGGLEQVTLTWNAGSGGTGYTVNRSTNHGGPYTVVTNGLTAITYTDTGLADGTTYYYVVATVEGTCQNTNSIEVSATTQTQLTPFQQWQVQYFYSTTNPLAAATADADGTGQNNQFKYTAGLDPTNPASVFVLTVNSVTNQPTQMNVLFQPMAAGRTYTPQFNTDLVNGVWAPLTTYTGPATNGGQIMVTDTNALQPQEFYRIDITAP
jgi:beta-glucanase (GH16 family)